MSKKSARVQRLCQYLQYLFIGWLITIPIIHILIWVFFNHLPPNMFDHASELIQLPIPPGIRITAGVVSFALAALDMAIVWMLIRLFSLYRIGKFFLAENVTCLWNISKLLLLQAIATPVFKMLIAMLLSFSNPPGQRMLSIGLSSHDLSAAMTGGIVFVIAYVMEEGRKLQDEQSLTI